MGIFGNAFGWPHLIIILVIVLLLFGAPKLPALAKSIGQSMKIFKNEIKSDQDERIDAPKTPVVYTEDPPAVAPTAAPADTTGSQPKQ
jgi:sec-independent protein translocase protein TatA